MKRFLVVVVLALGLITSSALAETLTVYGMERYIEEAFQAEHPGATIERGDYALNNTDVTRRLVNGEMKADVMHLVTDLIDVQNLAGKGDLLELSDNAYLMEQVARMHPSLQDVILRDGKLYAIPHDNHVRFFAYDPAGWKEAGYTEEDVPDSFPALLDLLEGWCDRMEDDPIDGIRVFGHFDSELYSNISYTRWLTEMLLEQHILQTDYAGVPLRFGGTFLELLKRIETLGPRIFRDEPKMTAEAMDDPSVNVYSLFVGNIMFIEELPHAVGLRLSEDDPILMRGLVMLLAVPSSSKAQAMAADYLELYLRALNGEVTFSNPDMATHYQSKAVSIFRDVEPIESGNARTNFEALLQEMESLRQQLASGELALEDRLEVEDRLARYEQIVDLTPEDSFYALSPREIELWAQYGDAIYYPGPSAFDLSNEGNQNVGQLLEQFYYGRLTAEQLCAELDRIAQMIELEQQ